MLMLGSKVSTHVISETIFSVQKWPQYEESSLIVRFLSTLGSISVISTLLYNCISRQASL